MKQRYKIHWKSILGDFEMCFQDIKYIEAKIGKLPDV